MNQNFHSIPIRYNNTYTITNMQLGWIQIMLLKWGINTANKDTNAFSIAQAQELIHQQQQLNIVIYHSLDGNLGSKFIFV